MTDHILLIVLAASLSVLLISTHKPEYIKQTMSILKAPAHTLIIDAGHGGDDGGAVSLSGLKESIINLGIAQKAENIAALLGINTLMTRNSEDIDYPPDAGTIRARKKADQDSRVDLVNSCANGILLSIHQNYYPGSGPKGAQILYAASEGSELLGEMMQNMMVCQLGPQNIRTAVQVSDSIYLMRKIHCPAVLVECGFLSNLSDEAKLTDPVYQTKLAAVMIYAVETYINTSGSF